MNARETLLKQVSMQSFAAWDLHLYLDTHPNDQAALKKFEEHRKAAMTLRAEYEKTYGPLSQSGIPAEGSWNWTKDPWPWDYEGGN